MEELLLIVLALTSNLQCVVSGDRIEISTPKQSSYTSTFPENYGYQMGTSNCFVFEVQACADAQVQIFASSNYMGSVIIGGWGNTQSSIYHSSDHQVLYPKSEILSCSEFRKFKIAWHDGEVSLHEWREPCSWQIILRDQISQENPVKIGILTAQENSGDWIIYNQECSDPANGVSQGLWEQNITNVNYDLISPEYDIGRTEYSWQCMMKCQIYDSCCYVTYNEIDKQCKGFSNITLFEFSMGTTFWKRN